MPAEVHASAWTRWERHAGMDGAQSKPLPLEPFGCIKPPKATPYVVKGVILAGQMIVVYGESNSGKTFVMLDLALCVATGQPWRGRKVRQGAVVYIALEGGNGAAARVEAWKLARWENPDQAVPFFLVRAQVDLRNPEGQTEAVIEAVREAERLSGQPVALVVVDTLSRALAGGDENSSEDMGAVVINCDRIRAETKAALAVVHHSGKDTAKGARGWSGLRAATDTELEVLAPEEDDEDKVRTLKVRKQRDLEGDGAFPFTLEQVRVGTDDEGDPITSCVVVHLADDAKPGRRRGLTLDQQTALRILQDAIAERGEAGYPHVPRGALSIPEAWWRDRYYARAKPGADRKTREKSFRRCADALLAAGLVAADNGRVWLGKAEDEHDCASETGDIRPFPQRETGGRR